MKPQTNKLYFLFQAILAGLCLFLPFVYMKIGPGGYLVYGPTVPDIYIFGGYITGKDVTFDGINFAYKFQLITIIAYAVIALFCYYSHLKPKIVFLLQVITSVILLLFPFWMYLYTGGVWGNSDGADLTIYPHGGWIVYLALIYIQIAIFRAYRKLN